MQGGNAGRTDGDDFHRTGLLGSHRIEIHRSDGDIVGPNADERLTEQVGEKDVMKRAAGRSARSNFTHAPEIDGQDECAGFYQLLDGTVGTGIDLFTRAVHI